MFQIRMGYSFKVFIMYMDRIHKIQVVMRAISYILT